MTARAIAQSFIYSGYKATVFSTVEEHAAEASALPGHMRFYAEDALSLAGMNLQEAPAKSPNVVTDRELVTGQNPYSDREFADALVERVRRK